jgi:hypothetical protein
MKARKEERNEKINIGSLKDESSAPLLEHKSSTPGEPALPTVVHVACVAVLVFTWATFLMLAFFRGGEIGNSFLFF